MAETRQPDRRKAPRFQTGDRVECRLDVRSRVRLLDISATGALLGTEQSLPIGAAAQLKFGLATGMFVPDVEVRRTGVDARQQPVQTAGVMFTRMDERSRRNLEHFLKRASS